MATDREAYDIASILHQMELDLIASQRRTLALHLAAEREEGFKWEQWQTRKLEALRALKIEQGKIVTKYGRTVRERIMRLLSGTFIGQANAVEALFRSARPFIGKPGLDDRNFFGINQPKLQALIDAVDGEHRAAESATLRLMDDQYRQTLYRTQVYYNTGSVSLGQAIDMASKEFLLAGIRSIQYRNGARVNIASYSEMAIRTAKVRAQAIAQGAVMDDWGEHLVKVRSLGSTCELCAPWQGRVLIDDVWASGTADEGDYPMVSSAVSAGLGHPNCRHIPINPWFPDINEPEKRPTAEKNAEIIKNYESEQKQRKIERNIRKYKRLEAGSVDPDNRAAYGAKVKEWQGRMRKHLADNPQLSRIPAREKPDPTPLPNGNNRPSSPRDMVLHGKERSAERGISDDDIFDTLKNPLDEQPVRYDSHGRPSIRIIGRRATVAYNPVTGQIISVNKTHTKTIKKLERRD